MSRRILSVVLALAACRPSGSAVDGPDAKNAGVKLKDIRYEPGRKFAQTYCTPCHTENGTHPEQPKGYEVFQVDTYEQWRTNRTILLAVIDKWHLDGHLMPPEAALAKDPADADRKQVIEWLQRGSPNTPEGQ